MSSCLPHLWLRDTWAVDPALVLEICHHGRSVARYWCVFPEPDQVLPALELRVLMLSGLPIGHPDLCTWTVKLPEGWQLSGFAEEELCALQE